MSQNPKTEIYLTLDQLKSIDRAARSLGVTAEEFMANASLSLALEVHMNQILLEVNQEQFDAFEKLLSEPQISSHVGFEKLMALKPVWDKETLVNII